MNFVQIGPEKFINIAAIVSVEVMRLRPNDEMALEVVFFSGYAQHLEGNEADIVLSAIKADASRHK